MERRDAVASRELDSFGLSLALGVGVAVGLVLAFPALPAGSVDVGGVRFDAVGAVLVASAFIVPLGTDVLYQVFFLVDR